MKFTFISAEKASAPIYVLCKVLEVSRSGFYAWEERGRSSRSVADEKLSVHVAAAFNVRRGAYGSPRVHEELKAAGFEVSRKRVARLMAELGLEGRRKRRFKATTDAKHTMPLAENILDRNFEVDAPDVAWVTDITYVWTAEGWLYLASILDLFSRSVGKRSGLAAARGVLVVVCMGLVGEPGDGWRGTTATARELPLAVVVARDAARPRTRHGRSFQAAASSPAALRRTRLFQYGGARAGARVGASVGSPSARR